MHVLRTCRDKADGLSQLSGAPCTQADIESLARWPNGASTSLAFMKLSIFATVELCRGCWASYYRAESSAAGWKTSAANRLLGLDYRKNQQCGDHTHAEISGRQRHGTEPGVAGRQIDHRQL